MTILRFLALPALALLVACGGSRANATDCPVLAPLEGEVCETDGECIGWRPTDATLNTVVWTQTSVEFAMLTTQVYRDALRHLETAIADPEWTASPEQVETEYASLPPAIILDLDETVLDNSGYQAWLIREGATYNRATWNAWCEAQEATAIPGSIEFLQAANALGVAIFYVTNRYAETEEATLRNLEALGAPVVWDEDRLLLRDEREDWTSEKGTRREHVGESYRIVQLFGDNFGDFLDGVETTVDARTEMAASYDAWWGTRWFMLPNPQYGSWESAVLHGSGASTPVERHLRKIESMRTWSGPAEP